jgi:hypothetical protein
MPLHDGFVSLSRRFFYMSGLGPTAEVLSFACPKESTQRKRHPMPRISCAPKALNGVFRRGIPAPAKNAMHPCIAPNGLIRSNPPVFGAE